MAFKLTWKKVFLIFFFMFVLGFFIGYDYGMVTVHRNNMLEKQKYLEYEKNETDKMGEMGLTDFSSKDIMNRN